MSSIRADYDEKDFQYYEFVTKEIQAKQSVQHYLDVTQYAFRTCVGNFLHHELTAKEKKCITAVTRKWVASHVRATARFGEVQEKVSKEVSTGPTITTSSPVAPDAPTGSACPMK